MSYSEGLFWQSYTFWCVMFIHIPIMTYKSSHVCKWSRSAFSYDVHDYTGLCLLLWCTWLHWSLPSPMMYMITLVSAFSYDVHDYTRLCLLLWCTWLHSSLPSPMMYMITLVSVLSYEYKCLYWSLPFPRVQMFILVSALSKSTNVYTGLSPFPE